MSEDREPCGCCHGAGRLICTACSGLGARLVVVRGVEEEEWDECVECHGRKRLECPECHGTGRAAAARNVA